jgi:hypothetical protein
MRLNPEATYDCLFVANRLQIQNGTFAVHEMHLFVYLGCLLWLYQQNTAADWGYRFIGTELGAPFSQEVDGAFKELLDRGYFVPDPNQSGAGRIILTTMAEQALSQLTALSMNQSRATCLLASCASVEAFSIGMVSSALANEPELKRAHALPASRRLLEGGMQSQLYLQFDAIRKAIQRPSFDLRLPAVIWLTALYRSSPSDGVDA